MTEFRRVLFRSCSADDEKVPSRQRQRHDSDGDQSPPRKQRAPATDADSSPPRKAGHAGASAHARREGSPDNDEVTAPLLARCPVIASWSHLTRHILLPSHPERPAASECAWSLTPRAAVRGNVGIHSYTRSVAQDRPVVVHDASGERHVAPKRPGARSLRLPQRTGLAVRPSLA